LTKSEPVQATFAPPPAVKANVPLAIVADGAVEVQFVFDALFGAGGTVDHGFQESR
jgi:hypothetical protein